MSLPLRGPLPRLAEPNHAEPDRAEPCRATPRRGVPGLALPRHAMRRDRHYRNSQVPASARDRFRRDLYLTIRPDQHRLT